MPPVSPELEKRIIHGLLSDLNRIFDLALDTEPDLTHCKDVNGSCKPKILTIGGSHAGRISDEFEERGYTVLKVCKPGWRANKHPVSEIVPQVEELLKQLREDDIIIIECLDNTAYYWRTEEGGDIPVRKYVNGEYHVEGDLVLATRERKALMLDNLEPLLRVLRHRKVILVTPMPRYLYESCCGREDHVPNRMEDGFEEELRRSLGEFRLNIEKLLFIRNYRFKVVDPSPALPRVDSDGVAVWGNDPVHPLEHGYRLLMDLYIEEICNLQAKGGKRPGGSLQPPKKKMRTETRRQEWVENPSGTAVRQDSQAGRGGRGGRRG